MSRKEIRQDGCKTAADARRRTLYQHPGVRVVKTRRVDPMNANRGFIVTVEDRKGPNA